MMFKVMMVFDGQGYAYGTYADRNRANEVAMIVREERDCEAYIEEVE